MAISKVALPDDPECRRVFLLGLTSATAGWDDGDVALSRPALDPWQYHFDRGRMIGQDMARRNVQRKRALQKGLLGKVFRIFARRDEEKKRKDAIPELP